MLWDCCSVRTMELIPVSALTLSFVAPHTPAGHWGLEPPQRDETIRPPAATLIGQHWTRTCGRVVLTFRVTCILSFAFMRIYKQERNREVVNQPTSIISGIFPKYPTTPTSSSLHPSSRPTDS